MRQRARQVEGPEDPVVKRTVIDELERADAMGDAFEVVAETVGVVVEGIDTPLVAGVMMGGVADAVEQWVAQPDIWRGHVDPGAERPRPVGELPGAHPLEQIEVFPDGPVAPGRIAPGLVRSATIGVGFLRTQVADVGFPFLYQVDGIMIELLEVIAGKERLAVGTQ